MLELSCPPSLVPLDWQAQHPPVSLTASRLQTAAKLPVHMMSADNCSPAPPETATILIKIVYWAHTASLKSKAVGLITACLLALPGKYCRSNGVLPRVPGTHHTLWLAMPQTILIKSVCWLLGQKSVIRGSPLMTTLRERALGPGVT